MENQFFEGGLYLMALGAAAAAVRYLPRYVFDRFFTASFYTMDTEFVRWMGEWLAETSYGRSCRRLSGFVAYEGERDEPRAVLEPGLGVHVFRYENRWCLLHQTLEEVGYAGAKARTITLRALGRDPSPIRALVHDVVDAAMLRRRGKQVAYINNQNGGWSQIRVGEPRPLESVVLRPGLMDEIVDDVDWFRNARSWHVERGLPYRRGYLLVGPSGNGKSSLVQAIAGHYQMPLYVLTLSQGDDFNDATLARAMAQLPGRSLVVLEDIEKIDFGTDTSVTLAGLLNTIDGPLASEGRLLVITANDADLLPAPLVRAGRIDQRWEIEGPGPEQVRDLFLRFFPVAAREADEYAGVVEGNGTSMAAIQQHLARAQSPEDAIRQQPTA